ncbi:MAG: tRNA (adenosine(37)-N6)-threonylcarbamoyltransferase complex dimerization subunit type 1 TsaB [Pseudomonadota bacterium]|nr:tRNA (adenosine(37)-N6)-threonylcarbamoyltransferase complex dimerization subunit type 1 TsaB [Pseudomonadota bacterium]
MKILAFDVTLSACSVAVMNGDSGVAQTLKEGHSQARDLVPLVQQVMEKAGVAYPDLNAVGVTTGPGSFTGVRLGLSAARGFGLALGIPVIGISTFDAIAASVPDSVRHGRPLLVVIDSRRSDVFVQMYGTDGQPQGQPLVLGESTAQTLLDHPLFLAGDGAVRAKELLPGHHTEILENITAPDPAAIARLAAQRLPAAKDWPPVPLYMRGADVTVGNTRQVVE